MLDRDGNVALHARKAVIALSIGPLLFGHFVAASTRLIDADITLDPDALAARLTEPGAMRALARGRLELVRGRIAWRRASSGQSGMLQNVDGWIDWPGAERPASYRLSGLWQDQVVSSEGEIEAPRELFADQHAVATLHRVPAIVALRQHREVRAVGLMDGHADDLGRPAGKPDGRSRRRQPQPR